MMSRRIWRFSSALAALSFGFVPQASATILYSLTAAEQSYSFLSKNFTLSPNPIVTGDVGLSTGGLLTLTNNTLNGRVDFQGTENDNNTGIFSVTGGEFANVALVGTALSDAQSLATTVAGLAANGTFGTVTTSHTLTAGTYDMQSLNLGAGATLTLSATSSSDQFVIRITNQFSLASTAQIVFSGPVNPDNVLFYYTGTTAISFSGTSVFQGIVLDNASNPKDFDYGSTAAGGSSGRVFNISGGDITFNNGTFAGTVGGGAATPEPATLAMIGGGLIALAFARRKGSRL
jgi:hypothetical protein